MFRRWLLLMSLNQLFDRISYDLLPNVVLLQDFCLCLLFLHRACHS